MSEAVGQDQPAFRIEAKTYHAGLGKWYAVTELWAGSQQLDRVVWTQAAWATSDLALEFAEIVGTIQVSRITDDIIEKVTHGL